MKKPVESEFRIEGRKAVYMPAGWEIWLDEHQVGRPRNVHWSLNRPAEGQFEELVKIMGAVLLEKEGC
jgi:hypothetical protein